MTPISPIRSGTKPLSYRKNRATQTCELPYAHATISGFTISTAERGTWFVTNLIGTPLPYDAGKEITLWQLKVKMENDATKETFVANR